MKADDQNSKLASAITITYRSYIFFIALYIFLFKVKKESCIFLF